MAIVHLVSFWFIHLCQSTLTEQLKISTASNIIKKDIIDYPSDEHDSYEEDSIENEEILEDERNRDIPDDEEMIDQCLETVNEVQTMANERSKMLLSNGKLAYE